MSHILTEEVAQAALELVKPVFDGLVASGVTDDRVNLHVIVFQPGREDILAEASWGEDPSTWTLPYAAIAYGKAKKVQQSGMVLRTLRNDAPWLYESGDVRYVGGVIENGLVVAASGLQDYWDEAISWMVLSAIQGFCRGHVANISADAPAFFPQ